MSLNLTPRAQYALEDYVTKHGQPVRLSINPGGCSGFDIAFASGTTEPDDLRFGDSGELIIDPVSLSLISGATVDYLDQIGKEGFVVEQIPNMEARCGCGKSFSVTES
ncbi:MAG: iron-sulfur cluster assembly accessory protein [Alphaproteobacteria bacterium]|nr:iron-sulfur cluster assembly accessory protein [Alphaproteobacteria bacterium]